MQPRFHPDPANSLQFSFDGSPSTLEFVGDFSVRASLKLEQHDLFHRVVRKCVEQLIAALRNFSQDIGRLLIALDLVDARIAKSRFSAYGSSASFMTIRISTLARNFSGGNDRKQAPEGVSIFGFKAAIGETTAETVERTVRGVMLVVAPPGLYIELLPGKLFQPRGYVSPQLFGGLLIPVCKLVNPGSD